MSGNMENGSADDAPIEELIDLIRGKPELWNATADDYRNTKMKKAAWESVAIGTSRSELWCKAEWTKLRNGFTRKKKQLIGKTGQGRKKIESSDYFQLLLFLDEVPNSARTRGNFSQDDDDGSGNSGDEREEMDLDKEDDVESTITSPQNESASSVSEGTKPNCQLQLGLTLLGLGVVLVGGAISGYKEGSPTQYHIQTDEGKERFFRFQTYNGQYRKERRLDDGTVIGSYGWVDPGGFLRMTDYIADSKGYRVTKNSMQWVGTNSILEEESKKRDQYQKPAPRKKKLGQRVHLQGKVPFKVVKKRITVQEGTPSPPVLIVYGPLRSGNVRNAKLVTRRRRPQGVTTVESAEETPGDVFGKYTRPRTRPSSRASFIYRIPEQYHREERVGSSDGSGSTRLGSFGYVDPFGIRRVIHYTANNSTGFTAQRDFKYVGLPPHPNQY